jgi:hypothetical protein
VRTWFKLSIVRLLFFFVSASLTFPGRAAVLMFEMKPEFSPNSADVLWFHRKGADLPIMCSIPERNGSVARLDTNTVYKFTVFDGGWMDEELLKIERGDAVLYEGSKCEVHGTKMEFKRVPILYGLLRPPSNSAPFETFAKLERSKFPHHREFVGGGCTVDSKSPKYSHAWLCKDCKAAFEKWEAQQNDRRP